MTHQVNDALVIQGNGWKIEASPGLVKSQGLFNSIQPFGSKTYPNVDLPEQAYYDERDLFGLAKAEYFHAILAFILAMSHHDAWPYDFDLVEKAALLFVEVVNSTPDLSRPISKFRIACEEAPIGIELLDGNLAIRQGPNLAWLSRRGGDFEESKTNLVAGEYTNRQIESVLDEVDMDALALTILCFVVSGAKFRDEDIRELVDTVKDGFCNHF